MGRICYSIDMVCPRCGEAKKCLVYEIEAEGRCAIAVFGCDNKVSEHSCLNCCDMLLSEFIRDKRKFKTEVPHPLEPTAE